MQTFITIIIVVGILIIKALQAASEKSGNAPPEGGDGDWDDQGWDEWETGTDKPASADAGRAMGRVGRPLRQPTGPLSDTAAPRPARTLDEVLRRAAMPEPPSVPPPAPPPPPKPQAPAKAPEVQLSRRSTPAVVSPPEPPRYSQEPDMPMVDMGKAIDPEQVFEASVQRRRREVARKSMEIIRAPRLVLVPPVRTGRRRRISLRAMGKNRLRQALLMREILDQPRAFDI